MDITKSSNQLQELQDSEVIPALSEWEKEDFAQCEKTIHRYKKSFIETGLALLKIRDNRWYRAKGFRRFDDYCTEEFGFGRSRAAQLVDAAEIASDLRESTGVDTIPVNESQTRPIMRVPVEDRPDVWKRAVELGKQEGCEVPPARLVEAAVSEYFREGESAAVELEEIQSAPVDDFAPPIGSGIPQRSIIPARSTPPAAPPPSRPQQELVPFSRPPGATPPGIRQPTPAQSPARRDAPPAPNTQHCEEARPKPDRASLKWTIEAEAVMGGSVSRFAIVRVETGTGPAYDLFADDRLFGHRGSVDGAIARIEEYVAECEIKRNGGR